MGLSAHCLVKPLPAIILKVHATEKMFVSGKMFVSMGFLCTRRWVSLFLRHMVNSKTCPRRSTDIQDLVGSL